MNYSRQLADINNQILQLTEELYKFNIGMRIRINELKAHMDSVGSFIHEHEKGERERRNEKEREEAKRQEEKSKKENSKPPITDESSPDSPV